MNNVVFDLGNVLLRFAPIEYLRTKIDDQEKVRILKANQYIFYLCILSCEYEKTMITC